MGQSLEEILHHHQLKKTLGRELVLDYFQSRTHAVSHGELNDSLGERINRASLYRILRDFEQSGIIHKVPDDEVSVKFAYCQSGCSAHAHSDNHVHFKCANCGETHCLEEVEVPQFNLPNAVKVQQTSILVSGVCEACVA